jgi:hypothetical protein
VRDFTFLLQIDTWIDDDDDDDEDSDREIGI